VTDVPVPVAGPRGNSPLTPTPMSARPAANSHGGAPTRTYTPLLHVGTTPTYPTNRSHLVLPPSPTCPTRRTHLSHPGPPVAGPPAIRSRTVPPPPSAPRRSNRPPRRPRRPRSTPASPPRAPQATVLILAREMIVPKRSNHPKKITWHAFWQCKVGTVRGCQRSCQPIWVFDRVCIQTAAFLRFVGVGMKTCRRCMFYPTSEPSLQLLTPPR
jgi:hypothetical protein